MSKYQPINILPNRRTIALIIIVSLLRLEYVVPEIEPKTLRYVATRLLPNECQTIIEQKFERSSNNYQSTNGIDCFRKLVGWTSDLRINRRDAKFVLGNRLHKIGRDDLATWLVGPASWDVGKLAGKNGKESVEYDSWKNVKSNEAPAIEDMDKTIFGKPSSGIGRIAFGPEIQRLKYDSPVMVDQESKKPATPPADGVTLTQNRQTDEQIGSSTVKEDNDNKNKNANQTNGEETDDKKKKKNKKKTNEKSKFSHLIPHFSDDKNSPCLRVPLSTALVVLGTIMTLTCCCALLLRNRIAACFERLRGIKKKGKTSKRLSADEEQGFMGPRTFGKPPARSGRRGGGSVDVMNVGIQNGNPTPRNGSKEFDERSTGCCNFCTRKKRKNNKRKRKK